MSVTAAKGFEAGGIASGIKPSGAPDLAMIATVDHRPVTAAGVFTSNLVAAAPVQVSRRHLADARAAAVVLNSGNANAATGEAGLRDAFRMAELTAAGLGCVPRDVLVCSTGLIGIPMPMDPVESGIPKLAGMCRPAPTAVLALPMPSSPPTPCARRPAARRPRARRHRDHRRDGEGCGDALARDGDDARGDHHRRRGRRRRVARDARGGGHRFVQRPARRRFAQHQRHRAPAGQRCDRQRARSRARGSAFSSVHRRAHRRVRRPRAPDGCRRRRRHQARAHHRARCAFLRRGAHCGKGRRGQPTGAVLALRVRSLLGPRASPSSVRAARASIPIGPTSPTRACSCARTGTRRRTTPPRSRRSWQQRDIDIECDLHAGTGTASVLFTDLTHAYVDENMGTS